MRLNLVHHFFVLALGFGVQETATGEAIVPAGESPESVWTLPGVIESRNLRTAEVEADMRPEIPIFDELFDNEQQLRREVEVLYRLGHGKRGERKCSGKLVRSPSEGEAGQWWSLPKSFKSDSENLSSPWRGRFSSVPYAYAACYETRVMEDTRSILLDKRSGISVNPCHVHDGCLSRFGSVVVRR